MIVTQRQLQQLLSPDRRVVLPYRARLTPLARDWVLHQKIILGYADAAAAGPSSIAVETVFSPSTTAITSDVGRSPVGGSGGSFVWWADGPDGVIKAAVGMTSRDVSLTPMPLQEDSSSLVAAVRWLNRAVRDGITSGGILAVKTAGPATVYANKCAHLRAVVGGSVATLEESLTGVAANVLVVERDRLTLMQVKNLLGRFCRSARPMNETLQRDLRLLAS